MNWFVQVSERTEDWKLNSRTAHNRAVMKKMRRRQERRARQQQSDRDLKAELASIAREQRWDDKQRTRLERQEEYKRIESVLGLIPRRETREWAWLFRRREQELAAQKAEQIAEMWGNYDFGILCELLGSSDR